MIKLKDILLEIGDASAKPFKVKGPSPKQVVNDMLKMNGDRTHDDGWLPEDQKAIWEFDGDKGQSYTIEIAWNTKRKIGRPMRFIKNKKAYKRWEFSMNIGFYAKVEPYTGTDFRIDLSDIEKERTTNLGEQYRILATVVDTAIPVINEAVKEYSINTIYIIPKADKGEPESMDNRRGRLYLAYIKKQIKKINVPVTAVEDKYQGGFAIKGGHISAGGSADDGYIRNESLNDINEIDYHSKLSRGHKPDHYQLGTSEFKPFDENFADGKKPGRKGLSKRVGVSQKMSIAQLAKIAKTATGERKRMAQWNLNMKRGRKKKK